ncbi:tRNA 2-thiouridine(34) synthase MnmA [Cuneatibacter sp. NSJ-177]|uniref:tRNA 2-thiouridine(34) synthase MnmA n=1 Tax=Cuneatibacter sp. NSJ-177 TaxID=2931401 RepID=UPI00245911E3|nr:tRNA 2-thiouridine(34) synthase MnmA [Cuneatibacter sp. NSJ-177]
MAEREKIVIGMSGGVDSSVAAWLLKEQGYDVIGVTMETWDGEATGEEGTCGLSAVSDAGRVADVLGIPHYTVDFRKEFRENVIETFMREYESGRTPNPCVVCNRKVKWEALLEKAEELGAGLVATGHYARILRLPNGRYALERAVNAAKDQTYALYRLTQDQLARTRMPLGAYSKDRVREMAEQAGLPVAHKPDSQEICFIPDQDYAAFIGRLRGSLPPEGDFVNLEGEKLGRHKGIVHYTVGQRKGLGIAFGIPMFVREIRSETNEVVLGTGDQVFSRTVFCRELSYMAEPGFSEPRRVWAKIRYSHKGAWATVRMLGEDLAECLFDEPVRAVTPGQAIVFYDGDLVLGGGTIIKSRD